MFFRKRGGGRSKSFRGGGLEDEGGGAYQFVAGTKGRGDIRGGGVPVCSRHQGEGNPRGGGVLVCNRHQGEESKGRGSQGEGDRDESFFPKGHIPREGGSNNHRLGEGGADYDNLYAESIHYYSQTC